jgi:hypothetical protein
VKLLIDSTSIAVIRKQPIFYFSPPFWRESVHNLAVETARLFVGENLIGSISFLTTLLLSVKYHISGQMSRKYLGIF